MKPLHLVFSIVLVIFCFSNGISKDGVADSLNRVLQNTPADTARVRILQELASYFTGQEQLDSALHYSTESIKLAENSGNQLLLAEVFTDRGKIRVDQGNHSSGLKDYHAAFKIYEALNDKKNEANLYNLIANAYHFQGDFPNALKNQYAALKIREEIGDMEGIAWSYNNIGTIYRIQGDYDTALENYFKTLRLLEKFGEDKMIAKAHSNIGNVYSLQGRHTNALESYISSFKIRQTVGDKKEIVAAYINIGDVFCDLYEKDSVTTEVKVDFLDNENRIIPRSKWLETAMNIQSKAHAINEEMGNRFFSIYSFSGMGRINYLRKNFRSSIELYSNAYTIAEEMNALELQKEIARYLADNYDSLGDFKNGMKWYVTFSAHKDSLFSAMKSDDLTRTRMRYEFDKKEAETKAIQDQKDAVAKVELSRQKKMRNIFVGGFALVLIFAGIFFYQRNHIRKEKGRSDDLLLNILPSEIADELKQTGATQTKSFSEVTVMFADFVDFTIISEKLSPELLVEEIHTCFSAFDHILQKHKVEKIKTIGDAYLCAGGLPVADPNHALHVIHAAKDMLDYMNERRKIKISKNEHPFELRIGIHSGPVVAGIVGVKKYAYDIWGDTVNIAARMEQNSEPGKINISNRTYELVKDKFNCTYRGKIQAKNKGEIDMYFLEA